MKAATYSRICIVGTSASGKSTLARELAALLNCSHIELDSLYHGPDWTPATTHEFLSRIEERTSESRWVIDGNYAKSRTITWPRADLIIWLDYRFSLIFYRVLKRTLRRMVFREVLWNGNREKMKMLFSKESIVWWVISTYHRRRKEIPRLLNGEYASIPHKMFRTPRETKEWVRSLRDISR